MSCTIGAPAPPMLDPAVGASAGSPATTAGGPGAPSAAVEGAVAGTQGGAMSSSGGGGTAVAGAAGAIGADQLMPVLQQLAAAIQQLTSALQPTTGAVAPPPVVGGGPAVPGSDTAGVAGGGATTSTGGCGCGGGAKSSTREHGQGAKGAPDAEPRDAKAKDKDKGTARGAGSADPALVAKWVTGDTKGLDEDLLGKLAQLGERMGEKVSITSGNRTRAEQEALYQKYLNGTGNLAAKPGTSNHEHGDAADAKIGGVNLASNPRAKQIAAELGLHFPVPGEPWHVEVK